MTFPTIILAWFALSFGLLALVALGSLIKWLDDGSRSENSKLENQSKQKHHEQ
jgi:hypothetical protein